MTLVRRPAVIATTTLALLAVIGAGIVLVVGTVGHRPLVIDRLSVGGPAFCGACDAPQTLPDCDPCDSIAVLARQHLDDDFPGHAPVASLTFHAEGVYPGPSGELILQTRSGSIVVAVAELADGSVHATSVYCGVGGCR